MLAPVLEVTLHELIVPEGFSQPWTNFLIRDVSRWRHCAAFSSAVDTHIRWFGQVIWKDIPRRIKLSNCYKSSTKMVYRRKLFANFEAFCAKVRLDKFVLHDSLRRLPFLFFSILERIREEILTVTSLLGKDSNCLYGEWGSQRCHETETNDPLLK